jgi:hypothetical protein
MKAASKLRGVHQTRTNPRGRQRTIACCRVSVREVDIFRLWLEYYAQHVHGFAVVILVEADDNPKEIEALCRKFEVAYRCCSITHFNPHIAMTALKELVKTVSAEWVIHADSDEFLSELPELPMILRQMRKQGADFASAWMADRLAVGGHLRSMDGVVTYADLGAAFPVRAAITQYLAQACAYKVVVCRWPCTGNMHGPEPGLKRRFKRRLTLEHFKWRRGIEVRLQKRISDHAASGLPWGTESHLILEELRSFGRIRAERWLAPRSRRIADELDLEELCLKVMTKVTDEAHFAIVGVGSGRVVAYLAEVAAATGRRVRLDAIDAYRVISSEHSSYTDASLGHYIKKSQIDVFSATLRRLGLLDAINLVQVDAAHGPDLFSSKSLDVVCFGTFLTPNDICNSIALWWPKVRNAGLLFGALSNAAQLPCLFAAMNLPEAQISFQACNFLLKKIA